MFLLLNIYCDSSGSEDLKMSSIVFPAAVNFGQGEGYRVVVLPPIGHSIGIQDIAMPTYEMHLEKASALQ